MIVVRCFGGLGNQMFQYAFYEYLKVNNPENIYFDISDFRVHNHHQGFELRDIFNVDFLETNKRALNRISFEKNNLLNRALGKLFHLQINRNTEFSETLQGVVVPFAKFNQDIFFNGFWQDKSYIKPIEESIRKKFLFINPLKDKNLDLINWMADKHTVGIHVRCGDYLKNPNLGNVCDRSYFEEAIKRILNYDSKVIPLIFTDSQQWVKDNLILPPKSILVDWNDGKSSYIDMQLMTMCTHNIISNSTFSWWGAWLNSNPGKIVIMPKVWNRSLNYNSLIWDGWKKI